MKTDSSMEFPMVLLRLADWFLYHFLAYSCYKAAMKVMNHDFFIKNKFLRTQPSSSQQLTHPSITKCSLQDRKSQTLVCDIDGSLLRTHSFFPYFMLVAFEGGSMARAFLLLLSSPFLLMILDHELKMRVMIFITFCGLGLKDMESVSRAVLPKFYLENMNPHAYDVWSSVGSKVVFTSVPRVMVESFLKDYLEVDSVFGSELHSFGRFYTGLVSGSGLLVKHRALKDYFGEKRPDIGLGSTSRLHHDHLLISQCKESYVITREDLTSSMPRNKYPKPLIFHDGRLAFLPTPLATLAMFVWLPFGLSLAIYRVFIGTCLPRPLQFFLGVTSGIKLRLQGGGNISRKREHALYVCTHRTLLDPIFLGICLGRPLTAVTYSLSKVSEMMAPIKTVRLTRDRNRDAQTMHRLLGEGDLVVCPEGTTCREPYLLRFSSLFAELTDEIVPVAVNSHVTMFYGTTARGLKCFDPIFFLMNPRPSYTVRVLEKLPKEMTCGGGGKSCHEVANYIQKQLAEALGFECTNLTRKDKYLMLAGNDGLVRDKKN